MNKEIKISIKSRWTGSILFEYSSVGNTLAKTVTEALKGGADLYGANLCDANLRDANLRGANLRGANLREAYLREADPDPEYNSSSAFLYNGNMGRVNSNNKYYTSAVRPVSAFKK